MNEAKAWMMVGSRLSIGGARNYSGAVEPTKPRIGPSKRVTWIGLWAVPRCCVAASQKTMFIHVLSLDRHGILLVKHGICKNAILRQVRGSRSHWEISWMFFARPFPAQNVDLSSHLVIIRQLLSVSNLCNGVLSAIKHNSPFWRRRTLGIRLRLCRSSGFEHGIKVECCVSYSNVRNCGHTSSV
ncbi:hypothetical protein N657DRAFT_14797 [Parathielavia appendiculata]|uniref:Uncharacterized protein n=1 Tax=Parathielavia appendiculata TaxID=2587402 RepID=A0AAN6Z7W1_9PEZI|nr:hypothetical protein N657DRAFT_14797 [Parathielavia appendiculata]